MALLLPLLLLLLLLLLPPPPPLSKELLCPARRCRRLSRRFSKCKRRRTAARARALAPGWPFGPLPGGKAPDRKNRTRPRACTYRRDAVAQAPLASKIAARPAAHATATSIGHTASSNDGDDDDDGDAGVGEEEGEEEEEEESGVGDEDEDEEEKEEEEEADLAAGRVVVYAVAIPATCPSALSAPAVSPRAPLLHAETAQAWARGWQRMPGHSQAAPVVHRPASAIASTAALPPFPAPVLPPLPPLPLPPLPPLPLPPP